MRRSGSQTKKEFRELLHLCALDPISWSREKESFRELTPQMFLFQRLLMTMTAQELKDIVAGWAKAQEKESGIIVVKSMP